MLIYFLKCKNFIHQSIVIPTITVFGIGEDYRLVFYSNTSHFGIAFHIKFPLISWVICRDFDVLFN